MAAGGQIYRRVQTIFGWTQLDSKENISDKFRKKSDQWSRDNEKNDYRRTDGWMADSTLNIEILPQNLILDVTALQVLKHVKQVCT